ncbi:MAG: hypothetical protein K0R09_1596 [Clostridiales bacterium]|jgi:hypothetical protein|nr:hypothetical protein [Clostridiales bacterium]
MKMSVNQEKAKKMSRYLRVVTQIFYWVGLVGAVLLAIAVVVVSIMPEKYFIISPKASDNIGFSIDGLINYRINSQTAIELSLKPIYQAISFMAAIILAGLSIIFRQISKILKTVEGDRPFSEENSRRLTIIGFVLLIGSFVFNIAEGIVANAMIHTLSIPNVQINYKADGFMMLTGFLLLILAGVFKYGNYLQQEYDATL